MLIARLFGAAISPELAYHGPTLRLDPGASFPGQGSFENLSRAPLDPWPRRKYGWCAQRWRDIEEMLVEGEPDTG
jgi:hypothetical protein